MPRAIMKRLSAKSPVRSSKEGSAPDRWDLTHLLRDPEKDYDALLKDVDSKVSRFEAWRDRLSSEMTDQAFQELLDLDEDIATSSSTLSAYAYLWFSENTQNLHARAFKTQVEERLTAFHNRMLFFDLWWQKVDDTDAARLLDASGDRRYHLESIRRFKPHTLSEPEEKIVNMKNITGRSAINTLYDVLTNGFSFRLTISGKKKTLTREELSAHLRSRSPRIREAAYKELYRVFGDQHDLIGEIYMSLVNDWKSENLDMRKFQSPIGTRNIANDVGK